MTNIIKYVGKANTLSRYRITRGGKKCPLVSDDGDSYYSKPQREEYFGFRAITNSMKHIHLLKFSNEKQILERA